MRTPPAPVIPKPSVVTPPPKPAPLPSPSPTEASPQQTAEQRRRRIAQARYGLMSTIKTSPLGIVGAGADLGPGRGKTALGA